MVTTITTAITTAMTIGTMMITTAMAIITITVTAIMGRWISGRVRRASMCPA